MFNYFFNRFLFVLCVRFYLHVFCRAWSLGARPHSLSRGRIEPPRLFMYWRYSRLVNFGATYVPTFPSTDDSLVLPKPTGSPIAHIWYSTDDLSAGASPCPWFSRFCGSFCFSVCSSHPSSLWIAPRADNVSRLSDLPWERDRLLIKQFSVIWIK